MLKAPLFFLFSAVVGTAASAQTAPQPSERSLHWYRGNTHTHTINSDGDSTPLAVAEWYRLHGYDFLFITDHGMVTDVAPLNALLGGGDQFLALPGEEVTSNRPEPSLAVHVNALGLDQPVKEQILPTDRETLRADLALIAKAGAIAQINHPNFRWQLDAEDIATAPGAALLEIANAHPLVNSFGAGPDYPSAEAIWDQLLTRGFRIWGVASDDMHQLLPGPSSTAGSAGSGALPGRGWIMVQAPELTLLSITDAIRAGRFYASTGVTLSDYQAANGTIILTVDAETIFRTQYRIQFIGEGGRVLQDSTAAQASYTLKPNDRYARVRISDSNGRMAWTQPLFVGSATR